jgi:ATP-dependent helicase Lhr and Lhr-like helicase
LPSLVELSTHFPRLRKEQRGLHTLYISPLKTLAVDVARNLEIPVAEMRLPVRIDQCRGAEGRLAPVATDRPRQSPHGRAV